MKRLTQLLFCGIISTNRFPKKDMKMKKQVCVIYTGGTIGMMPTENGYAPNPSAFPEVMERIHDVNLKSFPTYEIVSLPRLLDSSDITYKEWNEIGRVIYDRYDDFDGFVVLHGTDTMAYTASALSFMLEGLSKPVVFTGSQIPLCRLRSDGIDNLVTSMLVASAGKVREVCLYFGGQLMRANRVTKISADGLEAFASPNYPRLADIGTDIVYREKNLRKTTATKLTLQEIVSVPIAVLKIFPGIQYELFESVISKNMRGVVIEAFGAGNIPDSKSLEPILRAAEKNGVILTVCSQCNNGNVKIGAYASSIHLKRAGAVSGHDMTTEAAVAKLYYLFSKYSDTETIKSLMETDISGEITTD